MLKSNEKRRVRSGSPYEDEYGFCRAVRVGPWVKVAGTAPIWPDGSCPPDPTLQAERCFSIAREALAELNVASQDVVATRMFVTRAEYASAVGAVHQRFFGEARPAATMVVVAGLLDPRWLVEIEVEAFVGSD